MSQFLAMGGYAQFVWSAFGFWLVCLAYNIVSARLRIRRSIERAALAAARNEQRRNANIK